jgi:hypothetical protein
MRGLEQRSELQDECTVRVRMLGLAIFPLLLGLLFFAAFLSPSLIPRRLAPARCSGGSRYCH